MRIEIEIPKEFEKHFNQDKFKDSLERIMADIEHSLENGDCLCAGRYEYETIEMLEKAFENSKMLPQNRTFIWIFGGDNLKIERTRYVVMRNNRTEIWCGLSKHFHFVKVDEIKDVAIKTYRTKKQAESGCSSWDRDFEVVECKEIVEIGE